jgi:hypothetical protein
MSSMPEMTEGVGGDTKWHFYRKYNISPLPVIPINGLHIADTKVTPPEDGPSQHLKATQATRGPEEELRKSREELRVIHDNHSWISSRANEDECNAENPQQEAKATSATMDASQPP